MFRHVTDQKGPLHLSCAAGVTTCSGERALSRQDARPKIGEREGSGLGQGTESGFVGMAFPGLSDYSGARRDDRSSSERKFSSRGSARPLLDRERTHLTGRVGLGAKASILTYFESQHERSSYKRLSQINKLNVGKQVLSQEQIVFRKGLSSKGGKGQR